VAAKTSRYDTGAAVMEHLLKGKGREVGVGPITEILLFRGQGLRLRIPLAGYFSIVGLVSYNPSLIQAYRDSARYVDKILKGAKPGELPIEQPTRFEMVINLKTAHALGLTIPQSVLLRADQVIE